MKPGGSVSSVPLWLNSQKNVPSMGLEAEA
jgi:hypothetical protein